MKPSLQLALCIAYDILDLIIITPLNVFTLGLAGAIYDLIGVFVAYKFFGMLGLINLWEIIDVGNTIEGFTPTMTLTFMLHHVKNLKKF